MSDQKDKMLKLDDAFRDKFEQIDAEEIFESLHKRNLTDLKKRVENYEGDMRQLKKWMRSYVKAEIALSERDDVESYYKNKRAIL